MKKTAWLLLSLLIVAALVLSSCGKDTGDTTDTTDTTEPGEPAFVSPHTTPERAALARSEEPTYGGRLKTLGYDSTGWDPITTGMSEFSMPVLSRLLMFDWWKGPAGTGEWSFSYPGAIPPTNIFMGDLAESWVMLSEQSIVYTLKQGVMWQDKPGVMAAREVVAEDIIYNFQRMIDTPTHMLGNKYSNMQVTEMIAIDDYTVEFRYSSPSYWFPVLSLGHMNSMVPPEVIEQFGDMTDWRNVTGSGPFSLADYVSGSVISYDANPNWHVTDPDGGRLPYIDGMDILIITDATTLMTALRSGQLDTVSGWSAISWGDAESLWETNPELSWVEKGSGLPRKMTFDMRNPPFGPSDSEDALKIRRALSMAIDRVGMAEGYLQGHGWIGPSLMAPIYGIEELELENLPPSQAELFEYNPDKAMELLEEAGYPDGLKTTLHVSSFEGDYWSLIVAMWDVIGVEVDLNLIDAGAAAALKFSRNWTGLFGDYGALQFDAGFQWYYWTHPETGELLPSRYNIGNSFNETINDLTNAIDLTPDEQERQRIATQIQLIGIDAAYDILLPIPNAFNFWQPWVRGYSGEENVHAYSPRTIAAFVWINDEMRDAGILAAAAIMALEEAEAQAVADAAEAVRLAEEEAARAAAEAAGERPPITVSFASSEYVNEDYGFTILYPEAWTPGVTYGAYEKIGAGTYTVPGLTIQPQDPTLESFDPEALTVADYDGDLRAFILAEEYEIIEIVSETEGVLNNGTAVTIYEFTIGGEWPAQKTLMWVDVNGMSISFSMDPTATYPIEGGLETMLEIMLSLDF